MNGGTVQCDLAFGDITLVNIEQAADRPEGSRLAGSVGTEQGHDLTVRDLETDPAQDQNHVVVDDLEILDCEQPASLSRGMPPYQCPILAAVRTAREALEEIAAGNPLAHLADPRAEVRRVAVSACAGLGRAALGPLSSLADHEEDETVRAEIIEVLGGFGPDAYPRVWAARGDQSTRVVEAVATALGEIGEDAAVPWLLDALDGHEDGLVREAAIAALGSIGDETALAALLDAARNGKPQIRRRAVVALTAFEGLEVEAALLAARLDRNPMVREVAEGILGRPGSETS